MQHSPYMSWANKPDYLGWSYTSHNVGIPKISDLGYMWGTTLIFLEMLYQPSESDYRYILKSAIQLREFWSIYWKSTFFRLVSQDIGIKCCWWKLSLGSCSNNKESKSTSTKQMTFCIWAVILQSKHTNFEKIGQYFRTKIQFSLPLHQTWELTFLTLWNWSC